MRGLANAALATKGTSTTEVTFVLDCNVATMAVAPDAKPTGPRSSAAPAATPEAAGATGGACAAAGGAVTVTTSKGVIRCKRVFVAANAWLAKVVPELAPHIRACTNTVLISENPIPEDMLWRLGGAAPNPNGEESGNADDVHGSTEEDGSVVPEHEFLGGAERPRITALSCGDGAAEVYIAVRQDGRVVLGGLRDGGGGGNAGPDSDKIVSSGNGSCGDDCSSARSKDGHAAMPGDGDDDAGAAAMPGDGDDDAGAGNPETADALRQW